MSAKGRAADGYVPDKDGFFSTQPQVTRAILPFLGIMAGMRILEPSCGKGAIGKVLREHWGKHITIVGIEIDKERARQAKKLTVVVNDERHKVFDEVVHSDFYLVQPSRFHKDGQVSGEPFDISITNPSFSIWLPFAEHSFKFARETTFLLPFNSLASKKRAEWWRKHPAHARVLSKRPSFAISVKCVYSNGKRAAAAGASLCTFQELIALDETPRKECPVCGERTETTTSDSSEYSWMSWGPGITRGLWDVIDTPQLTETENQS